MADFGVIEGLQQTVIANEQKRQNNDKLQYNFDPLAMYFREDYEVKGIKISQPTIGDILEIGESEFYQSLSPFLYNSTSMRVTLWDMGINWCKVKDIEIFAMLIKTPNICKDALNILFKDIDITDFEIVQISEEDKDKGTFCLYSDKYNIILYEENYMEIAEYIRTMMNVHPKVEKAKGKATRKSMVDEDRQNALNNQNKDKSTLLPLVSACVNHPGFKYKLQELREVGICEFMDSVKRLQIYESTRALLQGSYSGFCDTSNISKEQFNFMRDFHKNEQK